jgi:predicted DNA-binding transcriptional regulator YafY
MISEASLPIVIDAIVTRHLMQFEYTDAKGETTTRTVEPYELKESGYFFGFDVSKGEIRQFRVDRMNDNIQILEDVFVPRWPGKVNGVEYPM